MGKNKGKGSGGGDGPKQPDQAQGGPSQPQQQQQQLEKKKPKKEQGGSGDLGASGDPGASAGVPAQSEQRQPAGSGRDSKQRKQKQEHYQQQQQQQHAEHGATQQGQRQQQGQHGPQPQGAQGGPQQHQQGGQRGPQPQGVQGGPQQHQQGGQRGPQPQGVQGGPQQHQQGGQRGPQQQGAWGGPQQHQQGGQRGPRPQGVQGGPQQHQQGGQRGPQQQGTWGGPQQHQQGGQRGPQQQGAWGGPQQHQQGPRGGPPQQQQGPPGYTQRPQGPRGGPPQQGPPGFAPQGPPGFAPQGPRGGPQQQGAWGGPQQQGPRGRSPSGPPHQQQQGAWGGQQRHQGPQGDRQQYPQQTGRSGPPQEQQRGWGGPQQKQSEERTPPPRASPQHQPRGSEERKELPVLPRAMAKLKIDEFKPSNIPVHAGTTGRTTTVEANYLDLNIKNLPDEAWQYDVVIEPDKPKKFLRLAFNEFSKPLEKRNIFLAFDGSKIAFSNKKVDADLLGGAHAVQIIEPDTQRPRQYKVTIKEADFPLVELSSLRNYKNDRIFDKPMRAVQCLDVVLRSAPADANFASRAGRNFYVKPKRYVDLDDGYELWLGLFQACVLGDRPLLNIDVCHKAFPSEISLIDFIKRTCDPSRGLDRRAHENVLSLIKGIDVSYQDPGNPTAKRFKCFGLGNPPARQMFEKDGVQVSVRDYFARDKKIQLRFPDLPCVMVSQGRIALPMEFCTIPGGQAINKKAGERQVRAMIKSAATTTDERKFKIMELFRMFRHDTHPIIRNFKITIGNDFLKLQARILDPPNLEYAGNQLIRPEKGSWQVRGKRFIEPSNLINWAILVVDRYVSEFDVRKFKDMMVDEGGRLNMNISRDAEIVILKDDRQMEAQLNKFKRAGKDLVMVVIAQFRDSYSKVKQPAEIRCGVLTQCIKGQTVQKRCNQSTVHNILLKVNAKLNGMNHKISKGNYENVMFLGADVTHPSPDQKYIPSVVGIAATHDRVGFRYNMRFRLQDPKQEMIQDMEMLFKEQLLYYKERNKILPKKIVYYRDGVSDGQFEQVRQVELNAIERAVSQVERGYKPQITCVICQKRHHTRFFPTSKTNDRFNNVPPGTVVDTVITHPAENQFFLVSHESIQGVAKPSKYCLIRDDSKFNIDELQSMTYNLCHMFTRCNRSVSYPAPAYYAHLAAARGRVYIEGANCNLQKLDFENKQRSIKAEIFRDKPMFFV